MLLGAAPFDWAASTLAAFLLLWVLVFGLFGYLAGQCRGRGIDGIIWGIVLGPIGWIIVALQPWTPKARAQWEDEVQAHRRGASVSQTPPKPPKPPRQSEEEKTVAEYRRWKEEQQKAVQSRER